MRNYLKSLKNNKGFTLIELLVVIAVLGVLAAVVLVAINPLEQLARGRDSGRLSSVAQLGHAVSAYYTAQSAMLSASVNPPILYTNANWQTVLVTSSDIPNAITAPTNSACAAGGSSQGSFCYIENATNFLVWTNAESNSYKSRAACTAAQTALFAYDSSVGKAGVGCVTTGNAPAAGIVLK